MGRADFRARAGAIFHMAGQARIRRCQYRNVRFPNLDDNQPRQHVAENIAQGVGMDFLEFVPVGGVFADKHVVAYGRVQLHVDGVLPTVFPYAVCQSVALTRGGQFRAQRRADDFARLIGGLVE